VSTIACTGICKSFGSTRVLEDLDLDVPDGAIVTVLGESGSGKTTLLRLIAGFERPSAGTIMIGGEAADAPGRFLPPEKRRIGCVSQEGDLFPHLTVASNVAFGLPRRERRAGRVQELLGLVGLGDLAKRYPHELSGGQQQRVALARALAPNPQVVLLDEPFSSLDASLRSSLRFDVMRILREQRATTVFVTHDQQEALSVADLVGIISNGRIRQFATPEALYTHPIDVTVARFLGEANIVPGTASHGLVGTAFGQLTLGNADNPLTGPAVVLVRPEQISLRPLASERPGPGQVTGRVIHREYYGHDCIVLVDPGGGKHPLRVRSPGRSTVEVGDAVVLSAAGNVVAWQANGSYAPASDPVPGPWPLGAAGPASLSS
jgi:iron(III) transport system ATP-binding protein